MALVAEFGAEQDPRLRPVAQGAAHDPDLPRARFHHGGLRILKGDLHPGIDLKQIVGGEQQSGFAHVDGFTGQPLLPAFQLVTKRDVKFMSQGAARASGFLASFQRWGIAFFHFFSVDLGCYEVAQRHNASAMKSQPMEKILRCSAGAVKERFVAKRYLIYFLDETISLAFSPGAASKRAAERRPLPTVAIRAVLPGTWEPSGL
jgi:hypothetical protein